MKRIIFLLFIFCTLHIKGQNITFTGTGLSSVKIENLTKDTSVTINASDVLTLSAATTISEFENKIKTGMKIYPNPMTDRSTFEVSPPAEGDAIITVYETSGKRVAQIKAHLGNSLQKFNVSGLNKGLYLINIKANTYQISGKLVCNEKSNGKSRIEKISDDIQAVNERKSKMDSKGLEDPPSIQYSPVDILKFTGVSGTNTTIVTAKNITQDTTITFEFIACTDGDGNNYPVVKIGTQTWIAENLKYLPEVNPNSVSSTTDKHYYVYGYQGTSVTEAKATSNYQNFGVLYNWSAALSACPTGWHLPSDAEWKVLEMYLGMSQATAYETGWRGTEGGKLKETGTSHWISPNAGATNETGFTALPGGYCWGESGGGLSDIGFVGLWYTSTLYDKDSPWGRGTRSDQNTITRTKSIGKEPGLSVRCLYGIDSLLISTEAKINDTLLWVYTKLHEYIEFTYLFDAIYFNHISAPDNTWLDIYQHSQTTVNAKILKLWSDAYNIIFKLNLAIKSADAIISDQLIKNRIIAQAKGIRAYLYYTLFKWFYEIPLEAEISESLIPRSYDIEVLRSIKEDATEAAQYLPLSWSASEKFRIPQSFAYGVLTRASGYDFMYPNEALTSTQQIINSGMYTLSADTNNFSSTNNEIFWGFEKSSNPEFNLFFNKGSFVPTIRYTETYLVSAFVLNNSGNTTEAVGYINSLILRRGGTPISAAELTKEIIYEQWQTEMAKEGNMFNTAKRFGNASSIVQGMGYKLNLPIPQTIIDSNPYMTQNPGY